MPEQNFDGIDYLAWTVSMCGVRGCLKKGRMVLLKKGKIAETRCGNHEGEFRDLPIHDVIEPFPFSFEPKKKFEEFFYGESCGGNKIHICTLDPQHTWLDNEIDFSSYCGDKVHIDKNSVFRVPHLTVLGPRNMWTGSKLCSRCMSSATYRFNRSSDSGIPEQ